MGTDKQQLSTEHSAGDVAEIADAGPDHPRYLINEDGSSFGDLIEIEGVLTGLSDEKRVEYRNANAAAIAAAELPRMLVVAGPGAGKSFLFLDRIQHWLAEGAERVYVATFVRKLVNDLHAEIQAKLGQEDAARVEASTLHGLARSLVERNGGAEACRLAPYIRIVDQYWANVVWRDILAFHPALDEREFSFETFADQLHRDEVAETDEWVALRVTYEMICRFYNAVGFAYLITLACDAVRETPGLAEDTHWIFDEYQDFNPAEDRLVRLLTDAAAGVLLAGDDEQALYQTLKASEPDIIIGYYNDADYANAMLPFGSRCSYHVCRAASAFMSAHRVDNSISKIYLPVEVDEDAPRVQVVATAAPTSAVDYVRRFLEEHAEDLEHYRARREERLETDPFLLILSHGKRPFGKSDDAEAELRAVVAEHAHDGATPSSDYLRVQGFVAAGKHPEDNYAVRKLLHLEGAEDEAHEAISKAIESEQHLADVLVNDAAEVLERAVQVYAVLEGVGEAPHEAVGDLVGLLDLQDPEQLRIELQKRPIHVGAVREKEDEDAVDTRGALAPVELMTMAGAKGLSAHHVVILGCDDVNLARATPFTFFVALTRARTSLHVAVSAKAGGARCPHPFVLQLPEECCDYLVFKKQGREVELLRDSGSLEDRFTTWAEVKTFGKRAARRGG